MRSSSGQLVFVVAGVSEPERADEAPAEHFRTGAPNSLLLVAAESRDLDDPLDCARRQALTDELAGGGAWTT